MGQVRTDHRVERVEERADGVDVVSRMAGRSTTEHFDRVVIAAGGLNSPIILQNSELGGPKVGHNLIDHPMGFVAKLCAASPSAAFSALRSRGRPLQQHRQHAESARPRNRLVVGFSFAISLRQASFISIRTASRSSFWPRQVGPKSTSPRCRSCVIPIFYTRLLKITFTFLCRHRTPMSSL